MKQNIFDIAGMKNTEVEEINKQYTSKSCLYHNNRRKAKEGKKNDLSNRIPRGGYIRTLDDLIKFGNAFLEGKLIARESLDKMLEMQPGVYEENKYGLGWFMYGPPTMYIKS